MTKKYLKREIFLLLAILLLGIFFRFYNLNWDQSAHLHPDERFLTMVGNAMSLPANLTEYLDPENSSFNPRNVGFEFFVYGLLPVSLNKIFAVLLDNDNYNAFTIQGRFLSAIADFIIVILIFKTVHLLERKNSLNSSIKFFAAFIYAMAILPIQLSHFFAVDTFLNLFAFASFYFALKFRFTKKTTNLILSAFIFGLGLSSKISGIFILPLLALLILLPDNIRKPKIYPISLLNLFLFSIFSYLAARFADPYIFASSNIFDPTLNSKFLENITTLKSLSAKDSLFPPIVQWINKTPFAFPLQNLAIFGLGIPAFILLLLGIFKALKERQMMLGLIIIWMIGFFTYQGVQTAMTMRYFLPLYPFAAILGGIGFEYLTKKLNKRFIYASLMIISIWPLMFISVYTRPHTRIAATEWIHNNIPRGSTILTEHWDDVLPLRDWQSYKIIQLPVFDPDTEEKWSRINNLLKQGDYIILSSNRGWGSIPTAPTKYPKMSKFYKDLFEGRTNYKYLKEFTSYPSLTYLKLPITFVDDWAEEAFTVYDHPKVMIFKNFKKY